MFTKENTEGFSEETLEEMNQKLSVLLLEIDPEDSNYDTLSKNANETVFNFYC